LTKLTNIVIITAIIVRKTEIVMNDLTVDDPEKTTAVQTDNLTKAMLYKLAKKNERSMAAHFRWLVRKEYAREFGGDNGREVDRNISAAA
jgi:hypothetical protein